MDGTEVLPNEQQRTHRSIKATTMSTTVWIQLYIGDVKTGQPFDVTDFELGGNVSALKKAVKEQCKHKLDFCDAIDLVVYAAGTAVPIRAGTDALTAWTDSLGD
eukprot:scaffold6390_cov53-Attheya_sp.AAC.1